jgi:DNA polymerase-3 subunit delta'
VSEPAANPVLGFEGLHGQAAALRVLSDALQRNRVAHAYLFEGPSGVGKQRAALALAAALLCSSARDTGACTCSVCERIRAGNHPDVRVYGPRAEGDRNLQVEFVRTELLPFARFAPFEAPAACVILPEADVSFPVHHAEAANALLKTLEEPRPRVTFILLAERPDRLLPTIRSRCQRVRFRPLPAELLAQILARHDVPEAASAAAISLAQGSADRALALASDGAAERLLELVQRIDAAVSAGRPGDLLDLADQLAKSEQLGLVLEALSLFYRDIAQLALQPERAQLAFPELGSRLQQRAASLGALRAAEHVSAIAHLVEAIDLNANPETGLDALLLGFASGNLYFAPQRKPK